MAQQPFNPYTQKYPTQGYYPAQPPQPGMFCFEYWFAMRDGLPSSNYDISRFRLCWRMTPQIPSHHSLLCHSDSDFPYSCHFL